MTLEQQIKHKEKRNKIIMLILIIIALISVGVTIWVVCFRKTTPVLSPDYAPQKAEQNAYMIEEDTGDKLEQQEGGGAVSLTYSKEVSIDLSENIAKIVFANPSMSNQNIVLQIVINNTVIAQSGVLIPGYQTDRLELLKNAKLSEGIYDGKFVVLFYQPDNGEKSILNTEIPLTITVKP